MNQEICKTGDSSGGGGKEDAMKADNKSNGRGRGGDEKIGDRQ
jgi:hypothetical protein